jgi:hypothetical protein
MVATEGTAPAFGIDTTVPATARIYDYWLGGQDNFAADRAAALAVSEAAPEARLMAVENRNFLRRAVRTGVLHFIGDDDGPAAIIATLMDAVPPGSYLVASHVTGDIRPEFAARAAVHYRKVTSGATLRSREEILRFFAGVDLVEPGLVQVPQWRPDGKPADSSQVWILGGVGRKPVTDTQPANGLSI